MKTCYIFGALPVNRIPIMPKKEDFIIAADKGVENVEKLGFLPNIIIGDFDSLGYIPDNQNKIVLPVRKDDTDIGYAIKYALEKGFDRFYIYGAIGGLLDHTFANIQLSASLSDKGVFAEFFGDDITVCSVTNGKIRFPKTSSGRISVFAINEAHSVTIKGLSFETENAEFDRFFPIGVSNEFIGKESFVEVISGTLTIMWQGNICALPG